MIQPDGESEPMQAFTASVLEACQSDARSVQTPSLAARTVQGLCQAVARPDVRNGALSLFDQAVVSATSFATSVIIGRVCLKEDLGIFYLALTIVYLARGVQEQVISAPYVVYCHGRRGEAEALYSGSSLLHQVGLSVLAVVALLGLLGMLSLGIGPAALAPAIWILLGVLPLLQLREFIRRLTIAHLNIASATAIDILVSALQLAGLVALAWFGSLTVTTAYLTMGGACALACVCWFVGSKQRWRFSWPAALRDWRHNWSFGRWALLSHMIGFTTPTIMPWFVTAICGSAEAGVLAACNSIVGTASMFMTGLALYLTPRAARGFAQGQTHELRRVLRAASLIYGVVLGSFALLLTLGGDGLLVFAYGSKYAGYGPVLALLAVAMLVQSLGLSAGIGLWAIDRPQSNLTADVCTLAVTLSLVFFLVEPWGVLGAALADLAGRTTGAVVRCVTLRQLLKPVPQLAEVPA